MAPYENVYGLYIFDTSINRVTFKYTVCSNNQLQFKCAVYGISLKLSPTTGMWHESHDLNGNLHIQDGRCIQPFLVEHKITGSISSLSGFLLPDYFYSTFSNTISAVC